MKSKVQTIVYTIVGVQDNINAVFISILRKNPGLYIFYKSLKTHYYARTCNENCFTTDVCYIAEGKTMTQLL